jgi:hypothetical protein
MKKILLLAFAFLLTGATATFAQTTTSAVSGRIIDLKGESLPGATIKVTYLPTNTSYGVVTNHEGRYFLANLSPGGPYQIDVTFVGYKTEKFDDLNLKLGETLKLDVTLNEDNQQLSEVTVVA